MLSEESSNPVPDLSLHISPPSSCIEKNGDTNNNNRSLYLSRSTTSNRAESSSQLELSLAPHHYPPNNCAYLETRTQHKTHPIHFPCGSVGANNNNDNQHLNHLSHGVSLLDVSDSSRPIKGIPVYHNRSFPFLPSIEQYSRDKCFYTSNLCSSSSNFIVGGGGGGGGLDHSSMPTNTPSPASYHHQTTRFGHGPQYYNTSSNYHGMMRSSRFLPKLPTKRSMRAPRMRWTSTLHARFVRAVELLGGHESTISSY